LRLFSFGGYGLALAALALVVFGAIECPPESQLECILQNEDLFIVELVERVNRFL